MDVLIAGSMGAGLRRPMARKGIQAVVTAEKDPERAARPWLSGALAPAEPAHDHDHEHDGKGCADGGGY